MNCASEKSLGTIVSSHFCFFVSFALHCIAFCFFGAASLYFLLMLAWLLFHFVCSYTDLARDMSYRSFLLDGVSQSSPSSSHSSTSEDSLNRTPQKKKGIKSSLGKLFSKKDKVKVKEGYGVTSPGRWIVLPLPIYT